MRNTTGKRARITGKTLSTIGATQNTTGITIQATGTIHISTTTQTTGYMTTTETDKVTQFLVARARSTTTTTTETAKGTPQTPMADKKEKKKRNLLVDEPYMTHQEIADYFGITRAAVADMERNALRKLKRALERKGFTLEDFFGEEWRDL